MLVRSSSKALKPSCLDASLTLRLASLQVCAKLPKNGIGAPVELQAKVRQLVSDLKDLNPTVKQTSSSVLNGEW